MDRKSKIRVNILISVIILIGFTAVAITSYTTYSKIIRDDIVNISKLTATNIYSDIRNELTKPIFVSLTMANDSFLKNWLESESDHPEHQKNLQDYLLGIRNKYDYDSVFLVSEATKHYYHYNGINKIISPKDSHDQWYYSFLKSGFVYDLDVDTDEANQDRLSVFVNCRITDENGKLLGVTGVGLEINQVQGLLKNFEQDFQLEALLFSADGVVQVDADETQIDRKNVFDLPVLVAHRETITSSHSALQVFQSAEQPFEGYYITRYIEDLNWYLLVKKDTSILEKSLYSHIIGDIIIYAFVVLCVLIIANSIIQKNDRLLMNITKTDLLTNLPNRRGFNERLESILNDSTDPEQLYVFVFDIDNFKKVNDEYGHLAGDTVLKIIGRLAAEVFSDRGTVCRWGGDEFAGYVRGEKQDMAGDIALLFKRIREERAFAQYNTTISLGVTKARRGDTLDRLIYRADTALYEAKEKGKNQYRMTDDAASN